MIVVKGFEMKKIDQDAIEKFGIPSIVLMENAARAFMEELLKDEEVVSSFITIFCGLGNNGGDGFAVARLLHQKNIKVHVVFLGDFHRIKGDALINFNILPHLDVPITYLTTEEAISTFFKSLNKTTIILDALLGTGCTKNVEGLFAKTIHEINLLKTKVYSVDIPSGVHPDHGGIMGIAIKATKTITFCLPKLGLFLYPGAFMTGDVVVVDIGIPEKVWKEEAFTYEVMDDTYRNLLPKRTVLSHKGTYGKALIIAGSKHMMGAAILAATAAYKAGCGLVKIMTEEGSEGAIFTALPEAIVETYQREEDRFDETLSKVANAVQWSDAVLVGPGMTDDTFTLKILEKVLLDEDAKIILDADALNALSRNLSLLENRREKIIITPHIGEMSRLTGYLSEDILGSTLEFAQAFSQKYGVITVLKSARTIIADGEQIFINIFGNSGMATAGSGDVLAGIIAGLLAQSRKSLQSATLGVFVHSKAGDCAKDSLGEYSLMARDITDSISVVMR